MQRYVCTLYIYLFISLCLSFLFLTISLAHWVGTLMTPLPPTHQNNTRAGKRAVRFSPTCGWLTCFRANYQHSSCKARIHIIQCHRKRKLNHDDAHLNISKGYLLHICLKQMINKKLFKLLFIQLKLLYKGPPAPNNGGNCNKILIFFKKAHTQSMLCYKRRHSTSWQREPDPCLFKRHA